MRRIRKIDLVRTFVAGAKWWEWKSQGATMWGSDVSEAFDEAERRFKEDRLIAVTHLRRGMGQGQRRKEKS